jgi:hypothetical protein
MAKPEAPIVQKPGYLPRNPVYIQVLEDVPVLSVGVVGRVFAVPSQLGHREPDHALCAGEKVDVMAIRLEMPGMRTEDLIEFGSGEPSDQDPAHGGV